MLRRIAAGFLDARAVSASAQSIRPLSGRGLIVERDGRRLLEVEAVTLSGSEITAVMGPNGAGKSLLLRVLAGLVAPDRGRIQWGDGPPRKARALRLGFVFQKPVLLRRSAAANVAYALEAAGVPGRDRRRLAQAALDEARLGHLADAPARVLSGGEQQRLALARAMSVAPEVLFLDEPTASADPASAAAIEEAIRRARKCGTKVVLVTHDAAQARRLAGEVLFMHRGRIEEQAPAGRFFERPTSEAGRAYLEGRIYV